MTLSAAGGRPLSSRARVLLTVGGALLVGGFVLAASVTPDPRGFGTHERLGLAPCTVRRMFGIPCPTCGMTTSFAHFVRGHIRQSARANVAGCLLAAICTVGIPWAWWSAWQGRMWGITQPVPAAAWLLGTVAMVAMVNWCYMLAGGL